MQERTKITVLTHFEELRRRIIFTLAFFFLLWVLLFRFFPHLVPWLIWPYEKAFPDRQLALVFTSLPEAVVAALKSTFFLALAGTLPLILWQTWRFLSPALYETERRWLRRLVFLVIVLFLFGVSVAYFLVLPHLLRLFLGLGYGRFEPYLRVQSYLSFLGKGIFIAGIVAQIPGFVALLIKAEILPSNFQKRRFLYLVGAAYLVALFIAPTDLLSQLILAGIFYFLLELGFILAKVL